MRVVSGKFRGSKLYCPNTNEIRPTSDRAKEALFNIIGAKIIGASFLDLYAGTGAVGLEAISRGAEKVTMVELKFIDVIAKNAAKLGVKTGEELHVIRGAAIDAAKTLQSRNSKFDFIFADPPWADGVGNSFLENVAPLLKEDGHIIIETFFKTDPPNDSSELKLIDTRRYGDTKFLIYKRTIE